MTDTGDPAGSKILVLYGRQACHLCEDMLEAIRPYEESYRFTLDFRDIDANPDWLRQYGEKIPVLLGGDSEICHFYLDPAALEAYFRGQL